MIKNYFLTASRYLQRNKIFSLISIAGFTTGFAIVILIAMNISSEFSFDSFHRDSEKIFRIIIKPKNENKAYGSVPLIFTRLFKKSIPGISDCARYFEEKEEVKIDDRAYRETVSYADPEFLRIFTFPLQTGSAASFEKGDSKVLISPKIAAKYFSRRNPIGELLSVKIGDTFYDLSVEGVLNEPPANSSFSPEILIPFSYREKSIWGGETLAANWGPSETNPMFFAKLDNNADKENVQRGIDALVSGHSTYKGTLQYSLQPLSEMHFGRNIEFSPIKTESKTPLLILSVVAFVIILIVSINYVNLTIAQASHRYKEIGLRKVIGAEKKNILFQFLGESVLITGISLSAAFLLAFILLPQYNYIMGTGLTFSVTPRLLIALIAAAALIALVSGGYPAYMMSKLNPASVLKGEQNLSGSKLITKIFMTFQFSMAAILISFSAIIMHQYLFLTQSDPGFNKDGVIIVKTNEFFGRRIPAGSISVFKDELMKLPSVKAVTVTDMSLGGSERIIPQYRFNFNENSISSYWFRTDISAFDALKIKMLSGRYFRRDFEADSLNSIIINRAFAEAMGMKTPINKPVTLSLGGNRERIYNVIGVAEDIHYSSFRQKVTPMAFTLAGTNIFSECLYVKINGDRGDAISKINSAWNKCLGQYSFDYSFLDDKLDSYYKTEKRWRNLILFSSVIAILFACSGLFGEALYSTRKRTREIGIRKVLGAGNLSVIILIIKDYSPLLFASLAIGCPAAYYAASLWLSNFAYRINLSAWHFVISSLLLFAVSCATILTQALKAATAKPTESLKYE